MGIFLPNMWSGSLLVMFMGAFDNYYNGASSASEITLVLGSSVALGQDFRLIYSHPNWKKHKCALEIKWSNYCTLIHWNTTQQIGIKY